MKVAEELGTVEEIKEEEDSNYCLETLLPNSVYRKIK